jgi:hypothetical protein
MDKAILEIQLTPPRLPMEDGRSKAGSIGLLETLQKLQRL